MIRSPAVAPGSHVWRSPRRPYAPGPFLELGPPATRHPVTSPGPGPIWVGRQPSANSRTQGPLLNPVTARWPDSRGTPAWGPRAGELNVDVAYQSNGRA